MIPITIDNPCLGCSISLLIFGLGQKQLSLHLNYSQNANLRLHLSPNLIKSMSSFTVACFHFDPIKLVLFGHCHNFLCFDLFRFKKRERKKVTSFHCVDSKSNFTSCFCGFFFSDNCALQFEIYYLSKIN